MATPCHILIEGNPVIIYASRNGSPTKVLALLEPFIEKFWQERELAGEDRDTPECLAAQILVRFGYEICEDDYSNLRIGINYHPDVEYLYLVALDRSISIWMPEAEYHNNPSLGLKACRQVVEEVC
jgi:hypothetical protein